MASPHERKPITYWIGEGGGWLLRRVVSALAATGLTPNMFTFLGMAVNTWAAATFAMGRFHQAAAVLFLAGFLDMADGQVAGLLRAEGHGEIAAAILQPRSVKFLHFVRSETRSDFA
ncbi:MAG: CDP-alcohol phosphatidyltransferase family protein, partial [Candidatus Acidiferrales bacterium]